MVGMGLFSTYDMTCVRPGKWTANAILDDYQYRITNECTAARTGTMHVYHSSTVFVGDTSRRCVDGDAINLTMILLGGASPTFPVVTLSFPPMSGRHLGSSPEVWAAL